MDAPCDPSWIIRDAINANDTNKFNERLKWYRSKGREIPRMVENLEAAVLAPTDQYLRALLVVSPIRDITRAAIVDIGSKILINGITHQQALNFWLLLEGFITVTQAIGLLKDPNFITNGAPLGDIKVALKYRISIYDLPSVIILLHRFYPDIRDWPAWILQYSIDYGNIDITRYLINQIINTGSTRTIEYLLGNIRHSPFLSGDVWVAVVSYIYQYGSLFEKEGLIAMYPKLNVDPLFIDAPEEVRTDSTLALAWLEEWVGRKYQPGSEEANAAIDNNDFRTGRITEACYKTQYVELRKQVNDKLSNISMIEVCRIISLFSNRIELDDKYENYTINDLVDVINQLVPVLTKRELCLILSP